jgi:hypothetical protein
MPKGKQRTHAQILADLEGARQAEIQASRDRLKEIEARIQATRPKVSEARKKEKMAEQFAIGRLVLPMLDNDTSLKRRLVEAAMKLDVKDKDRVALARVLGKLPTQTQTSAPVTPSDAVQSDAA